MNATAEKMTVDQLFRLAQRLSPTEQARLVVRLAANVESVLEQAAPNKQQVMRPPLRGLLVDLGNAPSAEEIDAVQKEMWGSFAEG
ncbi:MAG: hypothetical protein KC423_00995 [Anaerolineales bacterium]|nr:hypothetical protein [Anaerolineales bacterium]